MADYDHLTAAEIEQARQDALDPGRAQHLAACADCKDAVEAHAVISRKLAGLGSADIGGSRDCPTEELSLLSAGLLPDQDLARIMNHVATCDRCGAILAALMQPDTAEAPTRSGTPEWIRPLAVQMAGTPARKRGSLYRWWAVAAAALVLAVVGLVWNRGRTESPEALLASAYTSSRPFEFRLKDDGYAAVRQQRAGEQSALEKPAALLSAEREIQDRIAADPRARQTLHLRGRVELLERQYAAAIDSLTMARDTGGDDPELIADLSVAYALRGDAEGRSMDYGVASELLQQSVRLRETREAVFNLALVYERLSLVEEAIQAWQQFLRLEPSGGWSDEARARLAALQERLRQRNAARERVSPDPLAFVALAKQDPASIQPEAYQDFAWRDWLPKAAADPASRAAAVQLASLFELRFGDPFLQDATASLAPGLQQLGQATGKNIEGSYDEARLLAVTAEQALTGNRAAWFRARMEISYTQQRASAADCLAAADPLLRELERTPYKWLQGQASLQKAICLERGGDIGAAALLYRKTAESLRQTGFTALYLRAIGSLAGLYRVTGDARGSWELAQQGLSESWKVAAGPARTQQFAYHLAEVAKTSEWPLLAAGFGKLFVREIALTGNRQIEALDRVYLARLLNDAGDGGGAERELRSAEEGFRLLPGSPAVQNLIQNARLTRVEMMQDAPAALRELEQIEASWKTAAWDSKLRIKSAQAKGLLTLGDRAAAESALRSALDLHRTASESTHDTVARLAVASVAASAFKELTALQLLAGKDAQGALAIWDRYRGAEVRGSALSENAALTYAVLPSGVAAWMTRGARVDGRFLGAPAEEMQRVAGRFRKLCSSPESNLAQLRADAAQLYGWLIQPFEPQLLGSSVLVIDADEWLAGISFAALLDADGRYLSERFAIALADRGALSRRDSAYAPPSRATVVSAPGGGDARFPQLAFAQQEAAEVAALYQAHVDSSPEQIRAVFAYPNSSGGMLHFAGHGWSNGGDGGLVMPSNDGPEYLTAGKLMRQDWHGYPLVVLSACMTGSGEALGPTNPQSLVRAFLAGGTRSVIASQWNVDSAATVPLMRAFHEAVRGGARPAEALALAGRAVMRKPQWAHPYYWAGFAAFGEL